jgi:hypothetical protein
MIFSPSLAAETLPDCLAVSPSRAFQAVSGASECLSAKDYVALRPLEPLEARLVELMRRQWLSPQDALRLAGCFSLSQRVSELKREHGLPIVDEWRQVGRSRFKCYRLGGSA